jgi:endonuclease-3
MRIPVGETPVNRSTGTKRGQATGRESAADRKARASRICDRLAETYPDSACSLHYRSPFELLIATILSAQCTDKRVNMVTGSLFRRWPAPAKLAAADREHAGEVPQTLDELVRLPGVGRKTANVVLGTAFGKAVGVVVDTHVGRISRRLGLTKHADAVRAERDLMAVVPRDHWIAFSHRLIDLGRAVCTARKPRCEGCPVEDLCLKKGVANGTRPR